MSKNQGQKEKYDSESEDSLIQHLIKRDQQKELAQYLNYPKSDQKRIKDPNDYFKANINKFPGFQSANQAFKPKSKFLQQQHKKSPQKISESPKSQSTVSIPQKKPKPHDSKLNKQIQKTVIKDIEDIGGSCGDCVPKPKGLNYAERNKKLIKQHQERYYAQKSKQQDVYQPGTHEAPQGSVNNEFLKKNDIDFKQYEFNPYDKPQNFPSIVPMNLSVPVINKNTKFDFIIENSRIETQKKLQIGKHTVYFPYQPYEAQTKYMEQVLNALDGNKNAILQSPTGTGKTLCLLSAALSWVQEQYKKTYVEVPIVYLSRTHSQLAQVQRQLEKTCFRPTMATFGSREIFCIKDEFRELKGSEKVQACSKGVKLYLKYGRQQKAKIELAYDDEPTMGSNRSHSQQLDKMPEEQKQKIQTTMCTYYSNQRAVLEHARSKFRNKIITTQKIKQLGKTYNFCPYYYPQFIKPICNLYFMPYNYLLDSGLNSKYKELISRSILIFDEAHNVPQSAAEGKSFQINKITVEDAKKEIIKLMKSQRMSQQLMQVRNTYEYHLKTIQQELGRILDRFSNFVAQIDFTHQQNNEEDATQKKMFSEVQTQCKLYELLHEKCYDHEKKIFQNLPTDENRRNLILKMSQEMLPLYETMSQLCDALKETPDGIFQNIEKVASFVSKCIKLMFQNPQAYPWIERQINHYRIVAYKKDKAWSIQLTCLVSFLTLKDIANSVSRSIILTSGTLSPLDTWQSQLGISFPIRFSNTHVIKSNQLMLRVLMGHDKTQFNYSYKSISQNFKTIYEQTITALIQIAEIVPNGLLVILPSYKILNGIERCLQFKPQLRKKLNSTKKCFSESKDSSEDLIKKYRKAALEPKGALLFCVCRGKISEGIDFPNELCRSVVFIGIPFPNINDIVLKQKKNHYDKIAKSESGNMLSGERWYQNLTFRSVNQAIGRVIRHIYDFGTIFLMDVRYNFPKYKNQLPKWAIPSCKAEDLTFSMKTEIHDFYSEMEQNFGNYEGKNANQQKSLSLSFSDSDQLQQQLGNKKIEKNDQSKKISVNPSLSFLNNKKFDMKQKVKIQNSLKQKQIGNKPKNAFSMIMGTNQNKGKKKSSSNKQEDFY